MKIFWASNSPWSPSGYGQQTARFLPRLRDLGHDVAAFANHGLQGRPMEWDHMMVYPAVNDGWGNDVISAFALNHFGGDRDAGWVIALGDVWKLKTATLKNLHTAAWAPVDHTPVPPMVLDFFSRTGAVPIALSRHGEGEFTRAGLRPLYVPHGVDTSIYRPRPATLEVPADAFVFGMVAGNYAQAYPTRKAFGEVFQAFARIHERHPDTVLYLHTMRNRLHGGLELQPLLDACGLGEEVVFVDQFAYTLGAIEDVDMPGIYSGIDVLVNPSMGEGFGVPIIEAQACGTPVIVADNTAMPELVGDGWVVPSYPEWDGHQASWWGRVHTDELTEAMEAAYQRGKGRSTKAVAFAKSYDADAITRNHWGPALRTLERIIATPEASPVDLAAMAL